MAKDINDMIKITEAARNYLQKKGKLEVCIEYPEYRTSCECAFMQTPEIFAKKPKGEKNFSKVIIDGINVFLSNSVNLPEDNDIVIDLDSFLGIKILTVCGFSIKD